jgi:hypothetical protein
VIQIRSIVVRRAVSSVLLPLYLCSCSSWQVPSASPEQVVKEDQPWRIRVTLTDSSTIEMEKPHIVGDTLRGLVGGTDDSVKVENDVLLADIATLSVFKADSKKTKQFSLAMIGVALFVLVAVGTPITDCSDSDSC